MTTWIQLGVIVGIGTNRMGHAEAPDLEVRLHSITPPFLDPPLYDWCNCPSYICL